MTSQQQSEGETVRSEEENSWLSYRSRRSGLKLDAPPEIASLSFAEKAASKIGNTPSGLEALYHEQASAGIDTRLQFQWIRAHPGIAFSQCMPDHEEDFCLERTQERNKQPETNAAKSSGPTKSESIAGGSLLLPKVHIDLTELVEPPLLSNWVPGSGTRVSYEVDEDTNDLTPNFCGSISNDNESEAQIDCFVRGLVERAIAEVAPELSMTPKRRDIPLETTINIPSSIILHRIEREIPTEEAKCTKFSVKICCLCLLAESNPNEVMGAHVLAQLSPPFMMDAAALRSDMCVRRTNLTGYQQQLIKRLANALVSTCYLGKLSKRELRALMSFDDSKFASDALCELKSCMGEAYHRQK
eukprot:CAMPEP_0113552996 /NCGR_PEP_ID=MMETSP0015_2-20120614/15368_1 /TAXON_ID=2838 /ORGANISM="Odontella" /LENGTH=357 /DNA_ID=CAMNT_0000454017 /DNA_START=69 /DNA_END=1142 /DNA_ORIENTATION=- /assembly_acc=CAM_ASM_000160